MSFSLDGGYQPITSPSTFDAGGLFGPGSSVDTSAFKNPIGFGVSTPTEFRMADPAGTASTVLNSSPALPGGPLDGLSGLEKMSAYIELGSQAGNAIGNVVRAFRGESPVAYR